MEERSMHAHEVPLAGRRTEETSSIRRVIGASLFGTTLEWYDFFLYGAAAALVFNQVFFPTADPLTGTLLAFLTYAVAFGARPIGAFVFGHYGDKIGRKQMLVITLLIMGVATFLIGLLPTYGTIGVAAPILLAALRFIQGIGLGGEWGGAVLMAAEHGSAERRGLYASWPQVGVPAGNLLATGILVLFSVTLSDDAFLSWGWRVPFLLSAILVLTGLYIRVRISESPVFEEIEQRGEKARAPMLDLVKCYPRSLIVAVGSRIGTDVAFYTFAFFILVYVTAQLGLSRNVALAAVLIGSAFQLFLIPFFGALSDRFGRRPVYGVGAIGAAIWAFVFFALLDTASTGAIVVAAVGGLLFHAAMYGPQASFFTELFGTRVRYSGVSVGYQVAGLLGGAIAPFISVALLAAFDSWVPIAIYVVAALAFTIGALLAAPETAKVPLEPSAERDREMEERVEEAPLSRTK